MMSVSTTLEEQLKAAKPFATLLTSLWICLIVIDQSIAINFRIRRARFLPYELLVENRKRHLATEIESIWTSTLGMHFPLASFKPSKTLSTQFPNARTPSGPYYNRDQKEYLVSVELFRVIRVIMKMLTILFVETAFVNVKLWRTQY